MLAIRRVSQHACVLRLFASRLGHASALLPFLQRGELRFLSWSAQGTTRHRYLGRATSAAFEQKRTCAAPAQETVTDFEKIVSIDELEKIVSIDELIHRAARNFEKLGSRELALVVQRLHNAVGKVQANKKIQNWSDFCPWMKSEDFKVFCDELVKSASNLSASSTSVSRKEVWRLSLAIFNQAGNTDKRTTTTKNAVIKSAFSGRNECSLAANET